MFLLLLSTAQWRWLYRKVTSLLMRLQLITGPCCTYALYTTMELLHTKMGLWRLVRNREIEKCPIRSPTIPRFELQSALLAVRMNKMIQKKVDIPVNETFSWAGSMIILPYLRNTSKRFQTYVADRVNETGETSNPTQWRNCPGDLNPVDDCSCGLDPQKFIVRNDGYKNRSSFGALKNCGLLYKKYHIIK